jgi:hypothetical protein
MRRNVRRDACSLMARLDSGPPWSSLTRVEIAGRPRRSPPCNVCQARVLIPKVREV